MPKFGLVISFHISAASAGAVISGSSSRIEMTLLSTRRPLQQQRDAEAEHQLEADRQRGVESARSATVFQNAGVGQEVDVVVEPDEAAACTGRFSR